MDNGEYLPTIGDYLEKMLTNLLKEERLGQDTVINDRYIGLEGQDLAYRFGNRDIYFCVNHITPKIYQEVEQNAITTIDISAVSQIDIYHSSERAWMQVIDPSERCYHESTTSAVFFHVKLYEDKFRDENIKGIRYTPFYGYSKAKEFYHVNNSYKQLGDVDFRRTLYWNPNVKIDDEGKAKVSFYNNSSSSRIKISAEGISKNGIPMILK